jgi:hypothetical protein
MCPFLLSKAKLIGNLFFNREMCSYFLRALPLFMLILFGGSKLTFFYTFTMSVNISYSPIDDLVHEYYSWNKHPCANKLMVR